MNVDAELGHNIGRQGRAIKTNGMWVMGGRLCLRVRFGNGLKTSTGLRLPCWVSNKSHPCIIEAN